MNKILCFPPPVEAAMEAAWRLGFRTSHVRATSSLVVAASHLRGIGDEASRADLMGNQLCDIALTCCPEYEAARLEMLDLTEACWAAAESWTGVREQAWNHVRPEVRLTATQRRQRGSDAVQAAALVDGKRLAAWWDLHRRAVAADRAGQ